VQAKGMDDDERHTPGRGWLLKTLRLTGAAEIGSGTVVRRSIRAALLILDTWIRRIRNREREKDCAPALVLQG
jgi:hypothetical protein